MLIVSIDLSFKNIYKSWHDFRRGKRFSLEINNFENYLEENLFDLWRDLNHNNYSHGAYSRFIVNDTKKREIFVSGVRDRIVHRLIYNYLVDICDKTFIDDVWSNRTEKGLLKAIFKVQFFLRKFKNKYVWRSDIKKFFDSVNHTALLSAIGLKVGDNQALEIIKKIVDSYSVNQKTGIPIGNLTSQIFSNIYFNEFDRFVKHHLKPLAYLRYGDDFIIIDNKLRINNNRTRSIDFLKQNLFLSINPNNDIIIKARQGVKFLGVIITKDRVDLNNRNWQKSLENVNIQNLSSYRGLVKNFFNYEKLKYFDYNLLSKIDIK
ncbi:MAG: reverse transcriptase domain-containing protein [Patescibacteria group bacterium]|jgi:retron-type reverse transcriptase